ncbi:hypothetical protein [Nocardioides antri]|uniref:LppX_LprAFG lipoprotein n=1 Tax=Nocardioides antri TaxID=2607659 RepID=A0A5B1M5J5_9ACTN|nr:hypothetical protein [Nocardioides antri]KAA1427906.1 hypothetical protein F0U47_10875 [Nocardioides antri]
MNRSTTAQWSLAVLLLAAALAGCGGDSGPDESDQSGETGADGPGAAEPQPNGIMDVTGARAARLAEQATRALDDVVYEGRHTILQPEGEFEGRGRITITDQHTCEWRLSLDDLGRVTARVAEGRTYLRARPEVWRELVGLPDDVVTSIKGKWLALPEEERPVSDCYAEMWGTSANVSTCFEGVETGEVDGVPARIVQCAASGSGTHKLYISAVDEPVVLRRVGIDDDMPFDMRLVDSETGVTIEPPPEKDIAEGPSVPA